MATVFTRLLDDLLAELALITSPVPGLVKEGWVHWLKLNAADFPFVGIELGSEGTQGGNASEVVEQTPVDFFGYISTAQTLGTTRQREREEWLAAVWNRLTGEPMRTRLAATMAANGGRGCTALKAAGGAERDEGGTDDAYGRFRLTLVAIVHYGRGVM